MTACNLIGNDLREGIGSNKRLLLIPPLAVFECLIAHATVSACAEPAGCMTFFDLLTEIFHGCDPFLTHSEHNLSIPYFWLAIFLLPLFAVLDYLHDDLTQFGLQVLTRTQNRFTWWLSKCIWNLSAGICCYALFLLTVLLYCLIMGIPLSLSNTADVTKALAGASSCYKCGFFSEFSASQIGMLIFSPLAVICTLNMLQMILSLFCKPLFSFLITVGILLAGVMSDCGIAFSRGGMMLMSSITMTLGYDPASELILCLILIMVSFAAGGLYFQKYDILPDKE